MVFLVFAIIIAAVIGFGVLHRRLYNREWASAGERLGLDFVGGSSPVLCGDLEGHAVRVATLVTGSGKSRQTWTTVSVSYKQLLPFQMSLTAQGAFQPVFNLFGSQDHLIGDEVFDAAAVIKGDEEELKAFLTPARRLKIRSFLLADRFHSVSDLGVDWKRTGISTRAEELMARVRQLLDLAAALEEDRERERALSQAIEARAAGHIEEARALLQPAVQGDSIVALDEIQMEAELAELSARVPSSRAASPEPARPEAAAKQTRPSVSAPATELGPEALALAREFLSESNSFEIQRAFAERFDGARVSWSGTIERVEKFSYDLVFQGREGHRVRVNLGEIDARFGKSIIRAMVHVPGEAGAELLAARGQQLRFSGRLLKLDALSGQFYVADAEVL